MASLCLGILASALAELGVSHDAWVLAVEEDVLQGFILQVGTLDDVLQVRLREAYSISIC